MAVQFSLASDGSKNITWDGRNDPWPQVNPNMNSWSVLGGLIQNYQILNRQSNETIVTMWAYFAGKSNANDFENTLRELCGNEINVKDEKSNQYKMVLHGFTGEAHAVSFGGSSYCLEAQVKLSLVEISNLGVPDA